MKAEMGTVMTRGTVLVTLALSLTLLAACEPAPATSGPGAAPTRTVGTPALTVSGDVRRAVVAGQFYPADPAALQADVDEALATAQVVPIDGDPIAIMAPHAGYVYSGGVAGWAWRQVQGHQYDVVVIVAPNHRVAGFKDISVYPAGSYETPLGRVSVDSAVAQALLSADPRITFDPQAHAQEHAVEVQVPFLQRALPGVPMVAVVMGEPTPESAHLLAQALAKALQGKRALLVASSDMTHYPAYDDACRTDAATLEVITRLDPAALWENEQHWLSQGVPNLHCTLCGLGPVTAVEETAAALGANRATVVQYANSGDSPVGDRSQVVGYGAVVFWQGEGGSPASALPNLTPQPTGADPVPLTAEDRATLLRIARETLTQYLADGRTPYGRRYDPPADSPLRTPSAVFVTLRSPRKGKENGELRGCIGDVVAQMPLYLAVQRRALSAALEDLRFPPVQADELPGLTIEISVLSPLTPVGHVSEIVVGTHGLLIVSSGRSGLLLPQVPAEQGWDRDEFLRQACRTTPGSRGPSSTASPPTSLARMTNRAGWLFAFAG